MEITKLKADKDRRKILERKAKPKQLEKEKGMGKHKEKDVPQPMESWGIMIEEVDLVAGWLFYFSFIGRLSGAFVSFVNNDI